MKHSLNQWFFLTRPWSFPASAMPALVAISYVFYIERSCTTFVSINWTNGILAVLGAILFQIAGNLISDYFDFKHGVDREEMFGTNRQIVDRLFKPKTVLNFGIIFLILGVAIGFFLIFRSGWQLLLLGSFGVLSTWFYYKLKYNALGDLLIFIIYGQLIALGTVFVLTTTFFYPILFVSAPLGFLIVNILHANNTRDISLDRKANIKTFAMIIGLKGSKIQYTILTLLSYIWIVILVIFRILSPYCFIVLLTLLIAFKNSKQMNATKHGAPKDIETLDASTAQLVLIFSLLLIVANFASALLL
ncbi:MAG: prenyltransferase [Lentimicrobiaceae bacterium]|jgi:1,4-dihydroxy-2-naphthoate octaprenyltransferase|nr:prenyltransferase [Lentimicrobiaceae bacterium]